MPTFNQFAQWLFPGDKLGPVQNPYVPPEVQPLLDEVAQCTNISPEWIERTAGLVIDGLAGLQCLWYLHGAQGEVVSEDIKMPAEVYDLARNRRFEIEAKHGDILPYINVFVKPEWGKGTVTEEITPSDFDVVEFVGRSATKRTMKLGKWLRKHGASTELMHEFETREMPIWHWEISAHPYDVLTMSHDRPWTSCMRPGGEYQYGPLTDLAAGSALIFFYRPGADKPCGRRILRPIVYMLRDDLQGAILDGGTTYGCGPSKLEPRQIEEMIHDAGFPDLPVVKDSLCSYGHHNGALSRYIYSDTDHTECGQDDEEYNAAYALLDSFNWPESKLDFAELRSIAEEFKGEIEFTPFEGRDEDAWGSFILDLHEAYYDHHPLRDLVARLGLLATYQVLWDAHGIRDSVYAFIDERDDSAHIPEHIKDDVVSFVHSSLSADFIDYINKEIPVILTFDIWSTASIPLKAIPDWRKVDRLAHVHSEKELQAYRPGLGWIIDALQGDIVDNNYALFIILPKSVLPDIPKLVGEALEVAEGKPGDAAWTADEIGLP